MKEDPRDPTSSERQLSVHRTSSRGRWLVLALFVLGGLIVGGLFVARAVMPPPVEAVTPEEAIDG
jgi:hypothetical protein